MLTLHLLQMSQVGDDLRGHVAQGRGVAKVAGDWSSPVTLTSISVRCVSGVTGSGYWVAVVRGSGGMGGDGGG